MFMVQYLQMIIISRIHPKLVVSHQRCLVDHNEDDCCGVTCVLWMFTACPCQSDSDSVRHSDAFLLSRLTYSSDSEFVVSLAVHFCTVLCHENCIHSFAEIQFIYTRTLRSLPCLARAWILICIIVRFYFYYFAVFFLWMQFSCFCLNCVNFVWNVMWPVVGVWCICY